METFLKAVFLGFLQGITEFLPISSSGHLALSQIFFQTEQIFFLTLTVHFGTLISLIVFYRRDILFMIQEVLKNPSQSLFLKLITASLPVLSVGFFFYGGIKEIFNHLYFAAAGFLITAGFLLSTYWLRNEKINELKQISYFKAFVIGCFQVIALIPGVSRSGTTICAGIYLGFKPSLAVSFSFLLALPALFAACVLEFSKTEWDPEHFFLFIGSFFSAFVFGYIALFVMKKASSHLYRFSFYLFFLAFFVFVYHL